MWDIVKDASGLRANNIVGFLQINLSCPQARAHIGYRLEPTRSVSDVYPVEPSPFGVGMYAERAYLCKEGRDDFLTEAQMCGACVDQPSKGGFIEVSRDPNDHEPKQATTTGSNRSVLARRLRQPSRRNGETGAGMYN
ncbi:hypothetical protein M2333_001997 [Sphingobium sp. B11D3B]|uniref:hypothetical protein n=1 Tax=Sphingobium sp. B11D3B TaxID=2940575 RepID=UPI002226408E|nr:hypothetical protein [Sphingobium sp. B11D3B]MCW2388951.1 hypothetical protein [Sphingobium sp. B11D3B]